MFRDADTEMKLTATVFIMQEEVKDEPRFKLILGDTFCFTSNKRLVCIAYTKLFILQMRLTSDMSTSVINQTSVKERQLDTNEKIVNTHRPCHTMPKMGSPEGILRHWTTTIIMFVSN